jgi:hypothetical protein
MRTLGVHHPFHALQLAAWHRCLSPQRLVPVQVVRNSSRAEGVAADGRFRCRQPGQNLSDITYSTRASSDRAQTLIRVYFEAL